MSSHTKEMLVVNLYGGPGTGKSTHATGLYCRLKRRGYNSEYVHEYAKDKTWQEDWSTLKFQPYVTGKQAFHVARLRSKVDVCISDSPIPNGLIYQGWGCPPSFEPFVIDLNNQFNNLNIYLLRNPDFVYDPRGRNQTEEEALQKDAEMRHILNRYGIPYHVVQVSEGEESLNDIECLTLARLNQDEEFVAPASDEITREEIERKFLLNRLPDLANCPHKEILQGYIAVEPNGTEVRIRHKGDKYFWTVKSGTGLQRREVEREIDASLFEAFWPATKGRRLEKVRYELNSNGFVIELDIYNGHLNGLQVAEVEFEDVGQSQTFISPDWFGTEITGERAYANQTLVTTRPKTR